MRPRGGAWFRGWVRASVLGALLCAAFASSAASAAVVDVVGRRDLRFRWAPATGPVGGYVVLVSTNGGAPRPRAYVTQGTEVTVSSEYGDTISVSVMAAAFFRGALSTGAPSDASISYRFVADAPVVLPPPVATPATHYDFDGDGRADLLVSNPLGEVRLWSMDGIERIDDRFLFMADGLTAAAIGDFDGNGSVETLWRDANGRLFALFASGIADYEPAVGFDVAAAGDFDGDGRCDLLMRNPESFALEAWLLDGARVLRVVSIPPLNAGPEWTLRGSGDFDADGVDDLVWVDDSGVVSVWTMEDGQNVNQRIADLLAPGGRVAAIADLDGDDRSDLVVQENGFLVGWLMSGPDVISTATIDRAIGWPVVGGRDLDGDGTDDLVLASPDGQVAGLLMNGTEIWNGGSIEPSPSGFSVIETN